MADAQCPVVYVEGPSDVVILTHAKNALGFNSFDVRFESANGAGDITQFLKVSIRVKRDDRPLIGIFDADARGRREIETFRSYHKLAHTDFRTLERNRRIYAGALQTPNHLQEAEAAFRAIGMPLPLPIEFMFPRLTIEQAIEEGSLELIPRMARIANEELPLEINIDTVIAGRVDDRFLYFAKSVSDGSKINFANWAIQRPANEFEAFRPLFDQISIAVS